MSLPDLIGLAGILIGLGLLIWLAFKGWSVLLLAPLAAMVAALFSREPLLAHWTQTFMRSAAGFLAQFFPLFLLGALFGKLMEDSGSVTAIADFMTRKLGAKRAILAVVLGGAIVTYGGVSLFVAFFVIAPMAQDLFRSAAIPRRLMPAAIMLGTSTFTMSAMPGTPSIQNTIPMPFFGTTPFAAPGLGVLASLIMLGFGLWWLAREEAAAKRKGEGFGDGAPPPAGILADDETLRERATTAREFDPAEIAHGKAASLHPSIVAVPLRGAGAVAAWFPTNWGLYGEGRNLYGLQRGHRFHRRRFLQQAPVFPASRTRLERHGGERYPHPGARADGRQ